MTSIVETMKGRARVRTVFWGYCLIGTFAAGIVLFAIVCVVMRWHPSWRPIANGVAGILLWIEFGRHSAGRAAKGGKWCWGIRSLGSSVTGIAGKDGDAAGSAREPCCVSPIRPESLSGFSSSADRRQPDHWPVRPCTSFEESA
jgi:hypothetical protein